MLELELDPELEMELYLWRELYLKFAATRFHLPHSLRPIAIPAFESSFLLAMKADRSTGGVDATTGTLLHKGSVGDSSSKTTRRSLQKQLTAAEPPLNKIGGAVKLQIPTVSAITISYKFLRMLL